MRYNLESLGPERFQQLCQSILVSKYSGIQCFPVGQPDGGRDAIQYLDASINDFNVFQIKFVRKGDVENPREWVDNISDGEFEKVQRLIARGAKNYILVTNIQGTAHLDVGSIDMLNKAISNKFSIPTRVMWRDDIDAYLDNDWNIKLQYPDVMTGQDFLRLILEQQDGAHISRRRNALQAFLAEQYNDDSEVKFRQIDFQTKLLDIFIDLPFSIAVSNKYCIVDDNSKIISSYLRIFASSNTKSAEN
ncbi:hypothetical protein [Azospirillum cavernae]|uniref:hypothetical protein n=1 Tax=Azospirillum cavernae TaxID=2320860 RepID=UPI0011C48501|nr:hypothetical protein [Azospirillum cavernae]